MNKYEKYKTPVHQRAIKWLKENKNITVLFSIVGVFLILFLGWSFLNLLFSEINGLQQENSFESPDYGSSGGGFNPLGSNSDSSYRSKENTDETSNDNDPAPDDIPGIKVIEARAHIETENAEEEEENITELAKRYNGYSEGTHLSETKSFIMVNMTLRVPSDSFEEFFEELRDSSEVEDFSVRDYRIDIERRETTLDTIRDTIELYDGMIEETRQMEVGNDRITLTKKLTDEKADLIKKENDLLDSLRKSRRKSDYSTISLSIKEDLDPEIWPEDIGKRFLGSLRDSFDKIADSITAAIGNILAIFVTVFVWILYVTVTILPIWVAYRLFRRAYISLYRNREEREK